jgi:hypothetical protein
MSAEKESNPTSPIPMNSVSDTTGQFDPLFMLWRAFCSQNNIDVNLLVSQLNDEQRAKWEETKKILLKR